jgi:Domain found in Dishevelled, Egl-10, and Pleckstrin (DEP)
MDLSCPPYPKAEMLILQAEQVKYCEVVPKTNPEADRLPGVAYQGKLFVKRASYSKNQGQEAIKRTRSAFLEDKGQVLWLVIEDSSGFMLWSQNDQVQVYEEPVSKADLVSTLNLEELASKMRHIGGIKIKDRWYNLKVYPRCFVGSEAVAWLIEQMQLDQADAIRLGQRLIDEKWIHHVADQQPFQDGFFFYRFHWDD